jgi:hypothetical protein
MSKCTVHVDFFADDCAECKREYAELKGHDDLFQMTKKERRRTSKVEIPKYKEFTEERAKKLYEDLILQYLGKEMGEMEAAERARSIIRKQCMVRGNKVWPWVG